MTDSQCAEFQERLTPAKRWGALAAGGISIVAAGSYTTLAGLLSTQFDLDGWSAASISLGVGANMALYGITAPFAIYAMNHYGIRRVSIIALMMLIMGSVLCMLPNLIVFNLSWGLLIGLGTGTLTMAYGALVARTWFPNNLGTVSGVLTASAVFGQFALLPVWSEIAELYGWRAPLIGCASLAVMAMAANMVMLRDEPPLLEVPKGGSGVAVRNVMGVFRSLFAAMRRSAFWVLVVIFAICGATTNGLMWSHFTPAVCTAGFSVTTASSVLFLVGLFNLVGTVAAGWLTDRISPRFILAFVFFSRAGTLFWLPMVIQSGLTPQLMVFGVLFGILDVATVPPVITLCNRAFGRDGPPIFGWINAFHQIGAGSMALAGGYIWAAYDSYYTMWMIASLLSLGAATAAYSNRYRRYQTA